ncbi:MAG: hypothetical protein KDI06_18605, partial [Calditrichaeota bacterium]|nr:hypothetical protein [Calditrichota bacterium]
QRDGFNLVDIEPYKVKGVTRYAGLWRAGVTSDAVYTMDLTWEGLLSLRTQRQGNGYHLADLEAIEVNNEVRYIGLWHKRKAQAKIWKASSPDEVTRKNTEFEREGFSLSDIEIILESGKLRYLMIWQQGVMNTRLVLGANESVFAQKQLEMTSQGMILSDFEEDIIQGKKGMTGIWTAGSATLTAPVLDDGGLRILE